MTVSGPDFRQTWLWKKAFETSRSDSTIEEQDFFKRQYLSVRERIQQLVSRIAADLPEMTMHDISHLDSLWETASLVAEDAVDVNPAEAFVLGGGILLHDAAMSLSAYSGGLSEVQETLAWKDVIASLALATEESGDEAFDPKNPPDSIVKRIVPEVLRRLHAERAEELAEQGWRAADGTQVYLIEDAELRRFYGPMIGQIAHSHWWSLQKVERELSEELGALANRTLHRIDGMKLACLLRIADALHLDSRRAPRFLRAITNPTGVSALHWEFQERLSRPHIEIDAVVFTTGQPFGREEADAWWLAYDTLNAVDRELRGVNQLLKERGRKKLRASQVKGAGSPEILARSVKTRGWRPVDAHLQVSDVPRIVENLGGSKLYGNDPTVALRELIQNAADAVQARRKYRKRPNDWGLIKVGLLEENSDVWLFVEDNGIGMSERVLTGPLLDFGTSFWRTSQAMEEFPGLMSAGMRAIGRFGIGFFSVFMLGSVVRVYSRRCDEGEDTGRLLEFRGGTSARPILSPAIGDPVPIDGGTRIEILLKKRPYGEGGLLYLNSYPKKTIPLSALVGAIAPNLDVAIETLIEEDTESVARPGDWLKISENALELRLNPISGVSSKTPPKTKNTLMKAIEGGKGEVFGRAFIAPSRWSFPADGGWVTISGLRASRLQNVQGILLGEAVTAARDAAQPLVTKEALANWASMQAKLIVKLVKDEERQACSAEIILECGGSIGNLKIVKWGADWLTTKEFEKKLRPAREIAINFDGDLEYDEDQDEVHPKEFRDDFRISEDLISALDYNGEILKIGNRSWPRLLTGQTKQLESNIAEYIRIRIRRVWGNKFDEDEELRVVGQVKSTDITRNVKVFRIQD